MLAALLAVFGNLFYVLVYTRWLKRSTPQNIVIGGAAGAIPAGRRLGGGDRQPRAPGALPLPDRLLLDAAALLGARAPDPAATTRRRSVPMLPVVRGERRTARLDRPLHGAPDRRSRSSRSSLGDLGWIYLGAAVALGAAVPRARDRAPARDDPGAGAQPLLLLARLPRPALRRHGHRPDHPSLAWIPRPRARTSGSASILFAIAVLLIVATVVTAFVYNSAN